MRCARFFAAFAVAAWPSIATAQLDGQVAELQAQLMGDPAKSRKVISLENDPVVRSILEDPKTMEAIRQGDLASLLSDPKVRRMMEHPTVRELAR